MVKSLTSALRPEQIPVANIVMSVTNGASPFGSTFTSAVMDMAADSSLPLPADIMAEILSRTWLETVGNFRLLSKQVKKITDHPSVAKLLRERTKKLSGFLRQESYLKTKKAFVSMADDNPELSQQQHLCLDFLPANPVKILASTKSAYKEKYHNLFFDMFDSETWTWKNMGDVVMRFREMVTFNPQKASLLFKPLVSAYGKLYSYLHRNNEVIGFSLEDESWESFALPLQFWTYDMVLLEYEGRLGLLCIVSEKECMELWVEDDHDKMAKVYGGGDIAFLIDGEGQLIFYKFQDCCFFKVKLDRWYCFPDLFHFQSDIKEPETDLICTTPTRDDPLHW
ncbi:hypothetical protein FNV43_RR01718 [Rhamnella rubrinervis]|uniref:F-box domain-containing protein n=1 Tax=Rhamnella rubrinervis TaxID=2594499 RepID=A0A8K0HQY1_9ROSA|nr:hypothetical protein FNV43_RR01718 [Rhamnella rubrinervis]